MNDYKIGKFDAKPFVEPREIEYKKVDVNDFRDCHYKVNEVDIKPDSSGFVTKDIFDKIDRNNIKLDGNMVLFGLSNWSHMEYFNLR